MSFFSFTFEDEFHLNSKNILAKINISALRWIICVHFLIFHIFIETFFLPKYVHKRENFYFLALAFNFRWLPKCVVFFYVIRE